MGHATLHHHNERPKIRDKTRLFIFAVVPSSQNIETDLRQKR